MQELNGNIVFTFMSRMIFGRELDLQQDYPYELKDGEIEEVKFQELFTRNSHDGLQEGLQLYSLMFPFTTHR